MNLQEIFNTKREVDWQLDPVANQVELGSFEYDGQEFIIKIIHDVIDDLDVAAVSFSAIDAKGELSTLLTSHHRSYQIIGCVVNGLLAKKLQDTEDVIVFSAVDHVEARMSIYNRIVDRMVGMYFSAKFSIPIDHGRATVLVTKRGAQKPRLSNEELAKLVGKNEE